LHFIFIVEVVMQTGSISSNVSYSSAFSNSPDPKQLKISGFSKEEEDTEEYPLMRKMQRMLDARGSLTIK